jgi:hypothetical protein
MRAWPLVLLFAAVVGHSAWRIWGPPAGERYFVGGDVQALTGADPTATHLYLRRAIYCPERPRHAWLEVIGRDRIQVYVNEVEVAKHASDGFGVAAVLDITPYLEVGRNVIAIGCQRSSLIGLPGAAVDGAYRLSDGEHSLAEGDWRFSDHYERNAEAWFSRGFADGHWQLCRRQPCKLRAPVDFPPDAAREPPSGRWVCSTSTETTTAFAGWSHIENRPRRGWLRIVTSSSYRLAVNGVVIAENHDRLGLPGRAPAVERLYDITPVIRAGENTIHLLASSADSAPRVRVDGVLEDCAGGQSRIASAAVWLARPGLDAGCLSDTSDPSWQPVRAIAGDAGVPPWEPHRHEVRISLPWREQLRRLGGEVALMVLAAAAALVGCALFQRLLFRTGSFIYVTLLPSILLFAVMLLAGYDPRLDFNLRDHADWFWAALALVPVQWLLLLAFAYRRQETPAAARVRWGKPLVAVSLLLLLLVGGWLRIRMIDAEPLNPDEVTVYRGAHGVLESGWPSFIIHPDMPRFRLMTSELMFYPVALASFFFHDDRWVVRFPSVFFGILTIAAMYWAGRRVFHSRAVGLTAAAICALSPIIIQMAGFGRYFAELQLATIVMIVCFWSTLSATSELRSGWLRATVLAFIAMYLSWEGSALIALGMIIAALLERRGRLPTVIGNPAVYLGLATVAIVIVLQMSHRNWQQAVRLWYGAGASDITLTPMWRYPNFDLWYYVMEATWNADLLLPMLGLAGGLLLALHGPWQRPARFLLIIFVVTACVQALIIPVKAERYACHFTPLLILLSSAALVACLRWRTHLAGAIGSRRYARALATACAIIMIAVASGLTLQLPEMSWAHAEGYRLGDFKFAHLQEPYRYVHSHYEPGDIVLSTAPHVIAHHLARMGGSAAERPALESDFWPESRLHLQAVLDDKRPVPLHRLLGVRMIPSLSEMERLFATHRRIWYIADPHFNHLLNDERVTEFLRAHMQVVFEDFSCLVLFAGDSHRPAELRALDAASLEHAPSAHFPP